MLGESRVSCMFELFSFSQNQTFKVAHISLMHNLQWERLKTCLIERTLMFLQACFLLDNLSGRFCVLTNVIILTCHSVRAALLLRSEKSSGVFWGDCMHCWSSAGLPLICRSYGLSFLRPRWFHGLSFNLIGAALPFPVEKIPWTSVLISNTSWWLTDSTLPH